MLLDGNGHGGGAGTLEVVRDVEGVLREGVLQSEGVFGGSAGLLDGLLVGGGRGRRLGRGVLSVAHLNVGGDPRTDPRAELVAGGGTTRAAPESDSREGEHSLPCD